METDQETHPAKQYGGAAAKECCIIFSTTFLSLLPPLSLLLFARLSTARHQTSVPDYEQTHKNFDMISSFLQTKTTLVLSFLVLAAAIAALAQGFACDKRASLIRVRRRLDCAVVWVFTMQVCLSLWIHGVVEDDRSSSDGVGSLVFLRSLVLALGLHETVVLWRQNVVKPVVDEAVFGFSEEGFCRVEKVVLAAAFGWLWWRRLRREAEELVVLRRWDVEVVDVAGWWFYGSTAAVGGVRVIKGLLWVVNRIFRRYLPVNKKVYDVDNSLDLKFDVES